MRNPEPRKELKVEAKPALHRTLARLAKKWGVSLTQIVEWILTEAVDIPPGFETKKYLEKVRFVVVLTALAMGTAAHAQEGAAGIRLDSEPRPYILPSPGAIPIPVPELRGNIIPVPELPPEPICTTQPVATASDKHPWWNMVAFPVKHPVQAALAYTYPIRHPIIAGQIAFDQFCALGKWSEAKGLTATLTLLGAAGSVATPMILGGLH